MMAGAANPRLKQEWKMASLKQCITMAGLTVLSGLSLSGCATEKYVNEHIAVVSQRVDALEAKVAQVDQATQAANQAAQAAGASATTANQKVDQLTTRVDSIEQRLAAKKKPRN
jgi:murein lipoprotein